MSIKFKRLTTDQKPESLKQTEMSKIKGGRHVQRGTQGGAGGASACACSCDIRDRKNGRWNCWFVN